MSTLIEQREAASTKARAIAETAKAESRDLTPDEVTEVKSFVSEIEGLNSKIDAAKEGAALLKKFDSFKSVEEEGEPETGVQGKSLGVFFVKSAGVERLSHVRGAKGASVGAEFKAATDNQVTGGASGPLSGLLVQTQSGLVDRAPRELTPVSDLLSQGTITNGNAVQYFIEGPVEGDAGFVAEGGLKPQLHIADPEPEVAALKKIAGWIRGTDEFYEDLPLLASRINTRLVRRLAVAVERNVLNGNGTGSSLVGLLNTPGIQTLTATGGGVLLAEAVLDAQYLIEQNTPDGFAADAVVMNRGDYIALRKAKDGNDQYYGGGFFQGQYGNGTVVSGESLWGGLRVVVSSHIAAGTALVGAFADASTLYSKGGIRVDLTNSHEDDFTHNRVLVRAERRLALATEVPSAYVKITVTP